MVAVVGYQNSVNATQDGVQTINSGVWTGSELTQNEILIGGASSSIDMITAANSATLVTNSSGIPSLTSSMTDGQVLIGSSGATPALSTLTQGTGIGISNGAGSITISSTGVGTITGNTGGPEVPSAGNFNILGTGSVTVAGSTNTETVQLTGMTNHALLVGAGTATLTKVGPSATSGQVLQSQGSSADPAYSTATYPATTTVNQILYSSSTNVVGAISTANSASLVTNSSGVPSLTATMTDGQIVIGSTGATPTPATLTAGTGVGITNGAGSVTISSVGDGYTWSTITTTPFTLVPNNAYRSNGGAARINFSLPATSSVGDKIAVRGLGNFGWSIGLASGQTMRVGSAVLSGPSDLLSSINQFDSIELHCTVANTTWEVISAPQGDLSTFISSTTRSVFAGGAVPITAAFVSNGTAQTSWSTISDQQLLAGRTGNSPIGKSLSQASQIFTGNGTYTPTSGMLFCRVRAIGGGGGGGGVKATNTTSANPASGGGSGSFVDVWYSASTIGVSQSVTIGAAGSAGSNTGGDGGNGGTTSLGSLVSCPGGGGGSGRATSNVMDSTRGGAGGATPTVTGASAYIGANGVPGNGGFGFNAVGVGTNAMAGNGGSSPFGAGGRGSSSGGSAVAGEDATVYGGGGGGASSSGTATGAAGGAGTAGCVFIEEFVLA